MFALLWGKMMWLLKKDNSVFRWIRSFSSALLCRRSSGSSCCAFKYTLRSPRFHAIMLICGAFLAPFSLSVPDCFPLIFHLCETTAGFSLPWLRRGRSSCSGRPLMCDHQTACLLHHRPSLLKSLFFKISVDIGVSISYKTIMLRSQNNWFSFDDMNTIQRVTVCVFFHFNLDEALKQL